MTDTDGPYIVWEDYGYEGWHPRSFPTLKEAVAYHGFGSDLAITKLVKFDVVEETDDMPAATPGAQ